MKKLIFFIFLIMSGIAHSQTPSKGYLRYDSVYIMKVGGNGELVLLNRTRDSSGVLTNIGGGRTAFRPAPASSLQQMFDKENALAVLNKNDTIETGNNKFVWSLGNDNHYLTLDFLASGNSNGPGILTLEGQGFQQQGFRFNGKDPGFVRNQVDNTVTPTDAAGAAIPYSASAAGFSMRNTYSPNSLAQFYLGVEGNAFCDSCLGIFSQNNAGIKLATTAQPIRFSGSVIEGVNEWGQWTGGGHFLIGTTTDIGGKYLINEGSTLLNDTLFISDASLTGASNGYVWTLTDQTTGEGEWAAAGGGGLTVGTTTITSGTDTRVPFNDAGVYNEDAGIVYNKTTDKLTIGSTIGIEPGSGTATLTIKSSAGAFTTTYTYDASRNSIWDYRDGAIIRVNGNNVGSWISTGLTVNQGGGSSADFTVRSAGFNPFFFVDVSANVSGIAVAAPNSYFHVNGSFATGYVAKTGTYTATAADHTIECTSGTFTVTLPTAVGITGRLYYVTNSGAGNITIGTTSSETFVNYTGTPTSIVLGTLQGALVQSNGANWLIVSRMNF